mmetsp:Transcript_27385/g.57138  ORF Transcript_27385/g.57138 Transcript_27385/m.57138 type:complete len:282 (-) Transcript_27385:29-874(-)
MKRPLVTDDTTSVLSAQMDELESMRRAYKRARKAYKHDKSNKELKRAKSEAKKTLQHAEAAASEDNSPSEMNDDCGVVSSSDQDCRENSTDSENDRIADGNDVVSPDIKTFDEAYQKALSAFKANKSDKDLRRAKTAARRALDDAIAASTDGKQLVCVSCSKKFIFTTEEQQKYDAMGWTEMPKRCGPCKDVRAAGRVSLRGRLDSKKTNMCYAFQRGECTHGDSCKFSHNPEHGGKRSGVAAAAAEDKQATTSSDASKAEKSKIRKEKGLRKKGKGWRNK